MKRQFGILCPCLLVLNFSVSVHAEQVVEYSMYDEFGDIMFDSLDHLVKNDRYGRLDLEKQTSEIGDYRYRSLNGSLGLTLRSSSKTETKEYPTQQHQSYSSKQVWKFRPLEDEKDKKIVVIEDKPVKQLIKPGGQGYGYDQGYGYGYGAVAPVLPMMPMTPYLPIYPAVPGMAYPYRPW